MYCKTCGKEINDNAYICPFCGCKTHDDEVPQEAPKARKMNGLAIAGFVCSFFIAIVGLILSCIAAKQCAERGEDGAGFAKAGKIISIISIVLSVLYIVIVVVAVAAGAGDSIGNAMATTFLA